MLLLLLLGAAAVSLSHQLYSTNECPPRDQTVNHPCLPISPLLCDSESTSTRWLVGAAQKRNSSVLCC